MLTLARARKEGRLTDFIAQAEAGGVGPIAEADFDDLAAKVIRTLQSDDQTSGSLPADGLPGK
jgi:hypothetical protein